MSAPGEYDDKDVAPGRSGSRPAEEGEYDDKNVADDTHSAEAEPEPKGSFVDKDVEPRAATERGKGKYDDKDVTK